MTYHILNGDALKAQFPSPDQVSGKTIIFRECLINGPIAASSLDEFWENRERYIHETFPSEETYQDKVLTEFKKIQAIEEGAEVCLWFDEDLYCLINLTFTIHLILSSKKDITFYWIQPTTTNWWGYGGMSQEELTKAYINRIKLSEDAILSLVQAWKAFQQKDFAQLTILGSKLSYIFPQIEKVIQAHIERFPKDGKLGRPQQVISNTIKAHPDWNFGQIFRDFVKKEGIYGFGDLQVEMIYQEVKRFHGLR